MSKQPITHVATTDLADMLDPVPGRRMKLAGFDDEFVDFPDYIIRITDRIWHDRDVDLIHRYYAPDCCIHTQGGDIIGAQTVVDNTHATMKAFPDRRLDADNVVWSDDGKDGLYSSHLITSKMTNLGPSEFGPPTGKNVRVITIADCAARNNQIFEEWLVRDYAAVVEQMGFDVDETARKLAQHDKDNGFSLTAFHADNHAATLAQATRATDKPDKPEKRPFAFAKALFSQIWTQKDFSKLGDFYDFRVSAKYPGARDFYGHDQVGAFLKDVFTAIPDAQMKVEHVADIPYLASTRDMAVRWSLAGTHTGDGFFGAATGANIYILGVTHWRVIKGRIREEVTIWDDVAVRRMIEGARLDG